MARKKVALRPGRVQLYDGKLAIKTWVKKKKCHEKTANSLSMKVTTNCGHSCHVIRFCNEKKLISKPIQYSIAKLTFKIVNTAKLKVKFC